MYSENPNDLNFPLLYFDNKQTIAWTLEDALKGTQVFGGIGSGKSSGSGKTLAKNFLRAGYGGLVLCGKKDEKDAWVEYARECGRIDDLIVFSESNPFRFNFLDYEMKRAGLGGGHTHNIVKLYMTIHEMARKNGGSKGGEDQFWTSALNRLLSRLVELIKLAGQDLTVENMYNIIASAPRDKSDFHKESFINNSYCVACLCLADEKHTDSPEFRLVDSFWSMEFPSLDEKTRSIICESAYALMEPFLSGLLKELFTTKTNITPDITQKGAIIILDIPVQSYLELGVYAQCIFKYIWQQEMERRNVQEKPLPNFLWVDESQLFVNEHDMLFQTTARSSKTATVFLTQNISNYYAVMSGGNRYKEMTDSLLANLSTKIFHAQNDAVTNEWAAKTIAQDWTLVSNFHSSMQQKGASSGAGEQMVYQVPEIAFTMLRTGGVMNDFLVDAYITISGRKLAGGKNHMKVTFDQRR